MDDAANETGGALRFSCLTCRSRKMKCDRSRPVCTRCLKSAETCEYPSTRKRPVIVASRPKVKELAARLVDLEQRLETEKEKNAQQGASSASASASHAGSDPDISDLIETGRFERLPPPHIVEDLTNTFFARIHNEGPMLHQSSYIASLYLPPHMQPPMCLQYAVLALAASVPGVYTQLADPFYHRARQYLDSDEVKGNGQGITTLAHTQCFILMSTFEAKRLWWSRSCLSISRAVRMAQILGLDSLDGHQARGRTLPPARDWCQAEERRRTFWSIFSLDCSASSTTGWPILIDHRRIQTLLPASDEAYFVGIEESAATFEQALRNDRVRHSTSACQVLALHLLHQCLELSNLPNQGSLAAQEEAFWTQYQELDTGLAAAFLNLPERLKSPEIGHDAQSINANLRLHTSCIVLHRAGAARLKGRDDGAATLESSRARLYLAAEEVSAIVAVIGDIEAQFHNACVGFATFMAASVFLDDYVATQNKQSQDRFDALLDLMVAVGGSNDAAASLAVQLAHQVLRAGIDRNALDKVKHLIAAMDPDVPLMAEQDSSTGGVLFCPFAVRDDPSSVFVNMHAGTQRGAMGF